MVETLTAVTSPAASAAKGFSLQPTAQDVSDFKNLLNQANPVNDTLKSFVESAQEKLNAGRTTLNSRLKDFDIKDNVVSLVEATYQSSMNSISVQLTGRIGSKVSESFEQLVKQQ
ncbi:MAG TPA: hypothetical protein V6C65_24955 [Allocoleopsis sp.]|uniref:hypothetical protein n=1 Tax=Limnobacter sp. TaxID=2003368 RepID=UPI002E3779FC|nr:hypothetical protein [Limnobacter sp.]HEX5487296.1 hypothetical protein [Limnobacter sp.]